MFNETTFCKNLLIIYNSFLFHPSIKYFLNESQLGNKVLLYANMWTPEFLLASPFFVCSETADITSDCIQFYCLLSVLTHRISSAEQHSASINMRQKPSQKPQHWCFQFSLEDQLLILIDKHNCKKVTCSLLCVLCLWSIHVKNRSRGQFIFKFNNLYIADCRSVVPLFDFRSDQPPSKLLKSEF